MSNACRALLIYKPLPNLVREDPDETENQSESETNESPLIFSSMLDISITWQGVKKLIEGSDSGTSPELDDISPKLLKLIRAKLRAF